MIPFFKELFEYTHHFNQKLADLFAGIADKIPERSLKLSSHILNAHMIWNCRIEGIQPPYAVWDVHPLPDHKNIDKTNYGRTSRILDGVDLNAVVSYNTRGQDFKNSVRDILFHVVNHSTYHRGQIAADLRQNGIDPLVTDFTFYKR